MRRIGAHQRRLPCGWGGEQVAADVARRQTVSAQAREHEMGKVLADAFALNEDIKHGVEMLVDAGA